jgi:c(7)-type cytochrome triheme protein
MRRATNLPARCAAALAGVLLAGAAMASGVLQRLPRDRALAQGEGSPAPVTFSHGSHVDAASPGCIACHPKVFSMLEPGKASPGGAIRHEKMEAGAACGLCHGKTAFGLDSCELCHKPAEATP